MLSNNQSLAPDHATSANGPMMIDHLRQIAERHQVCYEVFPEWSMSEGQKISIGFELDLCGINDHFTNKGIHPVPGCPHCARTYEDLREIAEWILPQEERPSRYEIQPFDRAFHIAPAKRFRRNEVVVTIVIMHRSDFNRPVDECEDRCLKEMRQKLSQLGIRESASYARKSS